MQGRVQSSAKSSAVELRVQPQEAVLTTSLEVFGRLQIKDSADYYIYNLMTIGSKRYIEKNTSRESELKKVEITDYYRGSEIVINHFNRTIVYLYQKESDKLFYINVYDEDLNLIEERSSDLKSSVNARFTSKNQMLARNSNTLYIYKNFIRIKEITITKLTSISEIYAIGKDKALIYGPYYSSTKYAYAFVDLKTGKYLAIDEKQFDFKSFLPYMDINIKFIE